MKKSMVQLVHKYLRILQIFEFGLRWEYLERMARKHLESNSGLNWSANYVSMWGTA
jgi:hypothetical protein